MKTHNAWCVGLLRYFLFAIRWVRSDLRQLDRSTRKILRQTKSHHCHASIERLYLPRQEGGRGLTNLEHMWERETVAAARYLHLSQDPQVIEALHLQRSQTLRANQTSRANSQARTLADSAKRIQAAYGLSPNEPRGGGSGRGDNNPGIPGGGA